MKIKLVLVVLLFLTIGLSAQRVFTVAGQQLKLVQSVKSDISAHSPHNMPTPTGNGSTGFNLAWYESDVCGMNYVYGSVMTETRTKASGLNTNGTGFPATINISGMPASCSVVLQAYLYYDASYTEGAAPTTTATLTNPVAGVATYSATTIGTGPAKCWGETGTASYRADVTAAISGNGNYTINLNGFGNAGWEVDGCTLFIIYQSGPTTGTVGTLFIFDGADVENTYTANYLTDDTVTGLDVCNNTSIAQSFFIIADQTDDPASYTSNIETANTTTLTFPNNQWNFNLIPTTLTATATGTGFYPYRNDDPTFAPPPPNYDCYNWLMLGMYFQNTGCVNCIPIITNPTVGSGTLTNVSCFNGNDGSAIADVTGGTPPYTCTWMPAGGNNTTASGLSAGTYTVSVEDAICNTTSIAVTITQPTLLTVNASITTAAACGSSNGAATATANGGTSPYTYLWNPSAQTTATATGVGAGTYTVTATDNNGCHATASVIITQVAGVAATITAITDVNCNGGIDGSLTVTASGGSSPYTYLWEPGGNNNAMASGLDAHTYTVIVTDANGCQSSATANITQPPLLTATMGAATNPLCNGGTGSATVGVTGGTLPYTYAWAATGGNNATGTGLDAGTYTVTVTDKNACTASASTIITQPNLLTATMGEPTNPVCNGGTGSAAVTVTGGTMPYIYSWAPAGGNNATGMGLSAGTFTVTVADKNGCNTTATVTITQPVLLTAIISGTTPVSCNGGNDGTGTATETGGISPYTYLWEPGGNNNATVTGLVAQIYTVTITDSNGCKSTAITTVSQPAALTVSISGPSTLCPGGTGTLIATVAGGTAPYAYSWSPGISSTTNTATIRPTSATTYIVIITDANGCQTTGAFNVSVGSPLSVYISGKTSLCVNEPVNLCATTTGGTGGNTYNWQPGNYTSPCITVNPTATTAYTVSVMDNCGTMATSNITVHVNPAPLVAFHANPTQGCVPLCIQFYNTSTVSGGNIASYVWSFGNGDTSHQVEPAYCYPGSGQFNVTLTAVSDSGCSSTLNKPDMVSAFSLPNVAFSISPQPTSILSPTIQFTDETTDTYGITYWTWTYGDETDSVGTSKNSTHTYQDTGKYCATLTVLDPHGCGGTATNCLTIDPFFTLYIPSAFTPNGDGRNEVFAPKGMYVKSFEMYIFDRWGEQLYHSTNINEGWNGRVKSGSAVAQEDVYAYKILVTDWQNDHHTYIGSVTLLK